MKLPLKWSLALLGRDVVNLAADVSAIVQADVTLLSDRKTMNFLL